MTNDADRARMRNVAVYSTVLHQRSPLERSFDHRSDIAKSDSQNRNECIWFVETFARIYVLFETMDRANRYPTCTKRSSVITAIPFGASL